MQSDDDLSARWCHDRMRWAWQALQRFTASEDVGVKAEWGGWRNLLMASNTNPELVFFNQTWDVFTSLMSWLDVINNSFIWRMNTEIRLLPSTFSFSALWCDHWSRGKDWWLGLIWLCSKERKEQKTRVLIKDVRFRQQWIQNCVKEHECVIAGQTCGGNLEINRE